VLEVIHGKGNGVLRKAVGTKLKEYSLEHLDKCKDKNLLQKVVTNITNINDIPSEGYS